MTTILLIPLCFGLSLALSLYFVPVMRRAAIKWGVVDKPDDHLKRHREPIPYLGGIAVYLSFLLSLSLAYEFSPELLGIMLAGTIMLLIGLVDDFGVLLPYQKLAGQILATFVLMKAGIYIQVEFFPVWLGIALTVFWVIAIVNAVNIIDIMDGLSGGVSFVAALFLMVVAILNGSTTIAIMAGALAGALLGFLRFNYRPAKIFLGDAGSMFIGLMLAALSITVDYTHENPLAYIAPILILGVPIYDTFLVMLMRAKKRIPVHLGSPDHYAIRLKRIGWSVPRIVWSSYVAGAVLGGLAILNMYQPAVCSPIILSGLAFLTIGLTIWFNRMEE